MVRAEDRLIRRIPRAAAALSAGLACLGVGVIRRERLMAYRAFDRALPVNLLITWIFLVAHEQSWAAFGFVGTLALLVTMRPGIGAEKRRLATIGVMISRPRIALALAAVTIATGLAACGGDEDRVIVPDVEGLGVQAGIDRVCGRFLEPALTVDPSAAAAEPSVLVGSDPAAGAEVEVGSTVTLLSTPPPDGVTVVPEPSCEEP